MEGDSGRWKVTAASGAALGTHLKAKWKKITEILVTGIVIVTITFVCMCIELRYN